MTTALLKQALDALLCCSPDSKVSAALQIKTVADLRAELAHPDPWKDAIDAELVCLHLGTADSFPSANEALDALINWHIATALDPEVSASAKLLVDRGRAAVAEPLTEEEIATIAKFAYGFASRNAEFRIRFARAIEAAHGIGIKRSAA